MKKMNILIAALLFLISLQGYFGCMDDAEEIPRVIEGEEIGVPEIDATISGDRSATVSWRSAANAVEYRVYRKTPLGSERLVSETPDTLLVDSGLINGNEYLYSVAGIGSGGLEGDRSTWVSVVPSVYSIAINQGTGYTSSVEVVLQLTAPSNTTLMMISNDSGFSGSSWETFNSVRGWVLDSGDGEKEVYAKYQDESGGLSSVVSGSIFLDTYCAISEISITPDPSSLSPGDLLHFTMTVEDDEADGLGTIEVETYSGEIELFDNGRGGDEVASDGIYEADFQSPSNLRGTGLVVTGSFTDRAGNEAPYFEADERLSFTDPPEPVELLGASDSTTNSITIKWAMSEEENFRSYRIYRDTSSHSEAEFEAAQYLVQELYNQSQTGFPDTGLNEAVIYYYRIYVVNDLGEAAGSNEISVSTFDAVPEAVVLSEITSIGNDRVTLNWTVNQNSDFSEYRIYRSTTPGVTDITGILVDTITNRELTWYDDVGIDTTINNYYYRIYVYDISGKYSRSNEENTVE